MRFVPIGRPLSCTPSLYSRNDLPDRINVRFLARLASCSLISPNGDTAIENQWFESMLCLVQSGELPNEEGMINRQAMCDVLPLLESLGLKHGSGLHKWCGAIAVTALAQSPENVEQASTQVHKPSAKMDEWRQTAFPLERLLGGIEALMKTDDSYVGLYVSDDLKVPFSIPMMLAAVEACHETLKIPVRDNESRKKWITTIYPDYTFDELRVENHDHKQGLLNRAYLEGKVRHDDGELDFDMTTYVRLAG